MTKNIDPQLIKIGDYLKLDEDAFFYIPNYQRPYSWQEQHCDKLWSNIVEYAAENDKQDNYFFGTVILNCEKDDEGRNDKKLVLIDGQQRTTTFILLLKALLIIINKTLLTMAEDDDSKSLHEALQDRRKDIVSILYKIERDSITREPDKKDEEIYKSFSSLQNDSMNESDEYKEELKNILKSDSFEEAEKNVKKIPKKQKNNKYTNYFRNFKFFYERIDEMNESQLNIIAKTIIDKCEIIEIKSWQVQQAIQMFNSLNSDGQPLEDADIISAKLYASTRATDIETIRNKWSNIKELANKLSADGVIKGIDTILTQYMYYRRAKKGISDVKMERLRNYYLESDNEILQNPIKTCEDLLEISQIWEKVSFYPSVQVLSKLNENAKTFLGNYLFRIGLNNFNEETIRPIVNSLQRMFTILELSTDGYSSKNYKVFLFNENTKIVDDNICPETIEKDFKEHIKEKWNNETKNKDDIKNEIIDYDGNALVYLNELLVAREKGIEINFDGTHDIEHIMPSSGKNIQLICKDANIDDKGDFQNYINKLGNKIILEYNINRSIGNEWFRTKVSTSLKDKTGYIDSKFPIANLLVEQYKNVQKPYWTKEDIDKATKAASERIINFLFEE